MWSCRKWMAPWAPAVVGPRLPSQRCQILMWVNPTLTSSSPHWPIISPPRSHPYTLCNTAIFSHPCLPSLAISFSPSSLYSLCSPYLCHSPLLLTLPCCPSSCLHLTVALRRFQSAFGSSSNWQTDGQIKSPFYLVLSFPLKPIFWRP